MSGFSLFLYLWGCGKKFLVLPFLCFIGIVLGAKAEDEARKTVFSQEGANGYLPVVTLKIESEVSLHPRRGGTEGVFFYSTIGNIPVKVSAPLKTDVPQKGEVWEARGCLCEIRDNPRSRFERRFFWIGNKNLFRKVRSSSFWDSSRFYAKANETLSNLCNVGTRWCGEIADLNRAILLGNRSLMSGEMRKAFTDSGTIHVFAISGLHIVLVSSVLRFILSRLGFTGAINSLLSIPLLVAFVVLSGSKPSAVRALLMMSLMLLAPMFGRRSNSLCAWSVSVILIYSFKPEMLFDIGCTLSFAVMFGMVLVLEAREKLLLANCFKTKKTPCIWAEKKSLFSFILPDKMMIAVSLAAWVMSVPVTAYCFGRITFGSFLANFAVMLLAGYSVKFGLCALLAGAISTPLLALLNNCCALCIWAMVGVSKAVASLRFSSVEIQQWNFLHCIVWYVVWFIVYKVFMFAAFKKISGGAKWW
jgi:ComEC/Rec2-related protein